MTAYLMTEYIYVHRRYIYIYMIIYFFFSIVAVLRMEPRSSLMPSKHFATKPYLWCPRRDA